MNEELNENIYNNTYLETYIEQMGLNEQAIDDYLINNKIEDFIIRLEAVGCIVEKLKKKKYDEYNIKLWNINKLHSPKEKRMENFKILYQEIFNSKRVKYFLTKDPKKQNIGEKVVYKLLQKIKLNDMFDIKFVIGKQVKYKKQEVRINEDGDFITKKMNIDNKDVSKTIDFWGMIKSNIDNSYKLLVITHKDTNENGGHQDNQKEDVIKTLKYASKNKDRRIFFIGLVDGNYYSDTEIKEMKEKFLDNENIIITKSNKLKQALFEIVLRDNL